jgi:serine/threonine protein kinase
MSFRKEPNAEPIPGYRLIQPLGSGGFGEVWKCVAPGGLFKAIKFVYGDLNGLEVDRARAEEERKAIERIKAIRHPFLLSMDRVENIDGELVIVSELADKNLAELLASYQDQGFPGVPRAELLGYLREAAEVLDLMNLEHGLQHLDIKPRNLFLVSNHVKVADFGLVNSLAGNKSRQGVQLGGITAAYAGPEVFQGRITRYSDQYSLAIVYQELLTGALPFQGKNSRQMLLLHTKSDPDLGLLSPSDQAVLARALSKEPEKRYPTCTAFIAALLNVEEITSSPPAVSSTSVSDRSAQHDTDPSRKTVVNATAAAADKSAGNIPVIRCAGLANYRFLDRVGSSPLAEVWEVHAADGSKRLAKFVYGLSGQGGKREEEAIRLLKELHHPGLVATEIVESTPGRLVLLTDFVENTLRERCKACQAQKLSGIPAAELLEYLHAAAEVLDYVYQQHSLQHLGLNPRNLVLDGGQLRVADLGLAQLFWIPAGQPVAQRNARYCAPELFDKHVTRSSDQYSLALIYHEMLTGVHAFRSDLGQTPGSARNRGRLDLSQLPPEHRDVLARALHVDPQRRWPSCLAMVGALKANGKEKSPPTGGVSDRFTDIVKSKIDPAALPAVSPESVEALNRMIKAMITDAGGQAHAGEGAAAPTLSESEDELRYQFTVGLPLGTARTKLEAFCQQWYGQLVGDDEQGMLFHVNLPTNFWRQWIGRQPGLEVLVHLARHHALSPTPINVTVVIRPFRCNRKRGALLLREMGTTLLEGLRAGLLVNSERRSQDRLLWPHPVKVCPVSAIGSIGEPIECRGKDISLTGIGFYLPHELSTSQVCIYLPTTVHPPGLSLPATLVRAQRCADGWYDVGALFRLTALRKAVPELCVK